MNLHARARRVTRLAARLRIALILLAGLCVIPLGASLRDLTSRLRSGGDLHLRGLVVSGEDWCSQPCTSLSDYGPVFSSLAVIHIGGYLLLWIWGIWSLERLLRLYQQGRVFGRQSARRLMGFGTALVLWATLDLLGWLPWAAASGPRRWSVEPDLSALSALLVGFVFWIMAHVMREAAELAHEVELTI